tara:strand:- start:260 stop:643 length:384 start_codon:yes stop_codon:yes gene_type:complete
MKNIKIGSNKSFGVVFSIVFLIVALYPVLNNNGIRTWSVILSLIFLVLGLLNSPILSPLNKIWFYFGIFLGKIVSPLIMAIIFFIVVTPIGFIMRLLKKDILNLSFNNNKTYWIKKDGPKSKMKNQF